MDLHLEERLGELVRKLRAAHGEGLVSVILYGSAVAAPGNARPGDFRLLTVLRTLDAQDLRATRNTALWWESFGFPRPVYFTRREFLDSLDVFPVEFRQMKRAYRVLAGEDLLAGAEVSTANLRLLVEYELRGKLLRLRSLCLPAGDDAERLINLMTESVVSFVQFMRPALELLGDEPPLSRISTVRRFGERLDLDLAPVERLLRLRDDPVELMAVEVQDLLADYLASLDKIIAAVNGL